MSVGRWRGSIAITVKKQNKNTIDYLITSEKAARWTHEQNILNGWTSLLDYSHDIFIRDYLEIATPLIYKMPSVCWYENASHFYFLELIMHKKGAWDNLWLLNSQWVYWSSALMPF